MLVNARGKGVTDQGVPITKRIYMKVDNCIWIGYTNKRLGY